MLKTALVAAVMCVTSATTIAYAQNSVDGSNRSLGAMRLGEGETITMDGMLNDVVWSRAQAAADFRQVAPDENVDPSQPTRVQIAYNSTTLYVAWEVTETRDGFYTANVRQRDGNTGVDDFVRIFLDPHQSGRDAYMFVTHPLGARWDALLQNNNDTIMEWDADWEVRTMRTPTGWTAEMAIPFRELSLPDDGADWGVDVMRYVSENGEVMRWAQIDRTLGTFNVANIGTLTGISGIDTGLGLDVQVFGTARATHIWPKAERDTELFFDVSGNAFYKITPSLTGTLTVNTDFSDTPLDERIVSLSRFATFRNETRDFFLQDAAIFEFGGRNFGPSNGMPYFSRNIGHDLDLGGKLSGRIGGADVGALVTFMGDDNGADRQTLGVVRASHTVLDESRIGLIMTYGDPSGMHENFLGGVDFQHVVRLEGDATIFADAFFTNTYTGDDIGNGQAWGGVVNYDSDTWWLRSRFKSLEENYNPALGFANRSETREYNIAGRRRWRPEGDTFDYVEVWGWGEVTTDLSGDVESTIWGSSIEADFANGTYGGINVDVMTESLSSGFGLPGGVYIAAGDYDFYDVYMWWDGSSSWTITPHINFELGEFFGGDYFHTGGGVQWRPSPMFSVESWHNYDNIRFDTGRTEIYVGSLKFVVTPKPDLAFDTEFQYDNISGNLNMLARVRWEIRPGSEVFMAIGHSADVPAKDFPTDFTSNVSTAVIRIGHTMHW